MGPCEKDELYLTENTVGTYLARASQLMGAMTSPSSCILCLSLLCLSCSSSLGPAEEGELVSGPDATTENETEADPQSDSEPKTDEPKGRRPGRDSKPDSEAKPEACTEGDDNTVFEGMCYSYFSTGSTWYDARASCQAMGGDLVVIDSPQVNTVVELLTPPGSPWAWLRGTDEGAEGTWTWAGEPMSFAHWSPGEPNNHKGNENCLNIEVDLGGTWNDSPCTLKLGYHCQRPE